MCLLNQWLLGASTGIQEGRRPLLHGLGGDRARLLRKLRGHLRAMPRVHRRGALLGQLLKHGPLNVRGHHLKLPVPVHVFEELLAEVAQLVDGPLGRFLHIVQLLLVDDELGDEPGELPLVGRDRRCSEVATVQSTSVPALFKRVGAQMGLKRAPFSGPRGSMRKHCYLLLFRAFEST